MVGNGRAKAGKAGNTGNMMRLHEFMERV